MTATPIVLLNAQIHIDGVDLTGTANKIMLTETSDVKDATTFGSGGMREKRGGLMSVQMDHEGFLATPDPDKTLFNDLGDAARVTIAASDIAAGSAGYAFQGMRAAYAPLTSPVGEMAAITGSCMADSPDGLVRGKLALPSTTLSGITNSVGVNLGAISGTEALFAAVQVFTAGTTATVRVQSSPDNATWANTGLAQVVTATGGYWLKLGSANTDHWYRIHIDTVTGTFAIAALIAVQ